MSSGGGGGQQTVTQIEKIPPWMEDLSKENVAIASDLGGRPYQPYGSAPEQNPYQDWLGSAGPNTQREANLFMEDWNAGKIPGSPGYQQGNQNFGANPVFNQYLAGLTGFSDDFGGGRFQNYIASAPEDERFQYQQFEQDWNAGRIPGSPGYQAGNRDYGQNAELNQYLAGLTGYGGEFGHVPAKEFDPASLVAGLSPRQQAAMGLTDQAAIAYQPGLANAEQTAQQAISPWDSAAAEQYMSPFVMAALQPQLNDLDIQLGQQRRGLDAAATKAGAFGDSQHGVEASLDKYYGNMARQGIIGQGYQNAYNTGLNAFMSDKSRAQQGASQMADIAGMQQGLGLQGAESLFGMGSQEQELDQQLINTAYQNYLNELNWPIEQLNMRIAALSGVPYNSTIVKNAPPSNATAQNIGGFAALASLLGGL